MAINIIQWCDFKQNIIIVDEIYYHVPGEPPVYQPLAPFTGVIVPNKDPEPILMKPELSMNLKYTMITISNGNKQYFVNGVSAMTQPRQEGFVTERFTLTAEEWFETLSEEDKLEALFRMDEWR